MHPSSVQLPGRRRAAPAWLLAGALLLPAAWIGGPAQAAETTAAAETPAPLPPAPAAARRAAAGGGAALTPSAVAAARGLVAAAWDRLAAAAAAWRRTAPAAWQPVLEDGAAALGGALGGLDTALAAADPGYPAILAAADRDLVALQLAWRRTQEATPSSLARQLAPAVRAMDGLAAAMSHLAGGYGAAALRAARGGALSAGEVSQLIRLTQAAGDWQARLPALIAAARRQQDAALADALASLDGALQGVASAPFTLAGYLSAMQGSGLALALWTGSTPFVSDAEQVAWQQAESGAAALTTAADTGFVFTADFATGATTAFVSGPAADGAAGGAGGTPAGDGGGFADVAGRGAAAGGSGVATDAVDDQDDELDPVAEPVMAYAAAQAGDAGLRSGASAAALASQAPASGADLAAGGAQDGWIVIHGGTAGLAEAAAAGIDLGGGDPPAFAFQLGDVSGDPLAAALPGGEGDASATFDPAPVDAAAAADDAAPPLAWEPLCRPWQPPAAAGGDLCPSPAPPLLGLR